MAGHFAFPKDDWLGQNFLRFTKHRFRETDLFVDQGWAIFYFIDHSYSHAWGGLAVGCLGKGYVCFGTGGYGLL